MEAFVSDLHPRAEGTDRSKIFERETDGLRCRGEATIDEPLPRTALALCYEQFGEEQSSNAMILAFAAANRSGSAVMQCSSAGFP